MRRNPLEPDAPAPHIWPHWREAVRSWWAHRGGHRPSGRIGAVRGKAPGMGDVLRVGQVLRELALLDAKGQPTRHGKAVIAVALGAAPRADNAVGTEGAQMLVRRLERHLRKHGIVAKAPRRWVTKRMAWTDPSDDQVVTTRVIVSRA